MRVSNTALGSPELVSLVDQIHILALPYVFVAAVMAVASRKGYESGHKELARRSDLISFCVFGVSFLLINAVLIGLAAG